MDQGYIDTEHKKTVKKVKQALEELGSAAIDLYALGIDTELSNFLENTFNEGMPIVSRREMKIEERKSQFQIIRDIQRVGNL